MDDINFCRNMLDLVPFFFNGLWKEVVVSFGELLIMESCNPGTWGYGKRYENEDVLQFSDWDVLQQR